jgi:outer membrane protein assembly factor BamB
VFTTHGNINLYDGMNFHYIHRSDSSIYELNNYHGAYHVYIGEDDLLWVKDFKRVWCLDVKHEQYLDSPERIFMMYGLREKVQDLFVDSEKRLWCLTKNGLWHKGAKKFITLPDDVGELQDLDVMNNRLYLFVNTGEVLCYTIDNGTLLYRKSAYTESERHYYNKTSLVVKGRNGNFYQLRYGTRSAFFVFDTTTKKWEQIMTSQQQLCTLIVPNEEEAFISIGRYGNVRQGLCRHPYNSE